MRYWFQLCGPALLAGLFAAAGLAPLGAWYIALPAFAVIVFLVARADTPRRAAITAWAAGTGYFAASLNWIVQPFFVEPEVYGWMAPFAIILMAGGLALFWGLAGWLSARWLSHAKAFGFVLALSAVEATRGIVLTGFPWAQPGHMWIDLPPAQLAAWIGANGLTLLTLAIVALPVALRMRGLVLAIAVLGTVWVGGAYRLNTPLPLAPGLTVRLVQPNADQHLKWDPDRADELYRRLLDFTAAMPRPDLVVWPETALPYLYNPDGNAVEGVARAAGGVPVAMGVQRVDGPAAYNSLAVIGADGRQAALYDKAHLVPFGEYLPFGDMLYTAFGIRAFAAREGFGYAAGPGAQVLDLGPLGKALPLICYEAVFPQDVNSVTERPAWLLQITNDAWFGTLTGPFQHAAQARLRAVEQGLPLVRVANTGVTQMVDAYGRITAALPFGVASYLDAELPGPLPATLYHRWGEWPFGLLLWGGALILLWDRRRARA